jgi:acyl transferase domain-containing protein
LIYFGALAHCERLRERYDIVAVAGNSLGWYTALPASGALSPRDGWRLVQTMASLQQQVEGGQVLTTTVGDDWQRDAELRRAVQSAIAELQDRGAATFCDYSIRLGGHEVLAGTEAAVAELLRRLPKVKVGDREFPFRLAGHGPFHTRLCEGTAAQAGELLADLPLQMPTCHLIDGFGNVHSPWSVDPQQLWRYTMREQVLETFDFSACAHGGARVQPRRCCAPAPARPCGRRSVRRAARGLARPARQAGTVPERRDCCRPNMTGFAWRRSAHAAAALALLPACAFGPTIPVRRTRRRRAFADRRRLKDHTPPRSPRGSVMAIHRRLRRRALGAPVVTGKDALRTMEGRGLEAGAVVAATHRVESLRVTGDFALEMGTVAGEVAPVGQPPQRVVYHFVAHWRFEADHGWRIARLCGYVDVRS